MGLNVVDGDQTVRGTLRPTGFVCPAGVIGSAAINASSPIEAAKLDHQYQRVLAQAHGTAATAERRVIHLAKAAGSVVQVRAGVTVAAVGDATVSVDVRKNGATILSGAVSLTSAVAAFGHLDGSVSAAPYVADDVFEVVITVSAGTGTLPQGVFAELVVREAA